ARQAGIGGDIHSTGAAPVFTSASDLHLLASNASNIASLIGKAIPISVTNDIDCDTRNASLPTIGADEICPIPAISPSPAASNICPAAFVTLSASLSGSGLTYQ